MSFSALKPAYMCFTFQSKHEDPIEEIMRVSAQLAKKIQTFLGYVEYKLFIMYKDSYNMHRIHSYTLSIYPMYITI